MKLSNIVSKMRSWRVAGDPDIGTVKARTKSEARARFKAKLGAGSKKVRLAHGIVVKVN